MEQTRASDSMPRSTKPAAALAVPAVMAVSAAPVVIRAWGGLPGLGAAATAALAKLGVQPTPGVPIEMKRDTGRTASIIDRYQHPNRALHLGAA